MFGFSPWLIWFLVGVVFLLAELLMPGLILIFFCFGSWAASLLVALTDVDLEWQLIVFLCSSLILLFTLRKYFMRTFGGRSKDGADRELADRAVGKAAEATKRIAPLAPGEIKFRGSFWRAASDVEIEAGRPVVIVGTDSEDGLMYRVKPAGGKND
jgi:inner membrane protein